MSAGRPAPVTAYLRRPLRWAALLAVVAGALVANQARSEHRAQARWDAALSVPGTVVSVDRSRRQAEVSYVHPVTEQQVTVPVEVLNASRLPAGPGPVALAVDRDDPDAVHLQGDRRPGDWGWALASAAVVVAVPLGLAARRRWVLRRTERLIAAPRPGFAMTGAIAPYGRVGRRCELHLWPLDAPAGAPSLCRLAVLTTGGLPVGGPAFTVEVKGTPRPLGRVVARQADRDVVLVPTGRALLHRARGRPARHAVPAPLRLAPPLLGRPRAPHWWRTPGWRWGLLAASAALAAAVAGATLVGRHQALAVDRGTPVVVTVVARHERDGTVEADYQAAGGALVRVDVPADYPNDYSVGRRYPARVDPARPDAVRFAREPYDAVEPIAWSLVPLIVSVLVVAGALARWRAVRRTATVAGPWYAFEAWTLQGRGEGVALVVPGTDQATITMPGADLHSARWRAPAPVLVAGDVQPGGTVAVVAAGALLPLASAAGASQALAWWTSDPPPLPAPGGAPGSFRPWPSPPSPPASPPRSP